MSGAPLEITSAPTAGLRWAGAMAVAFTGFMVLLTAGCFLALLTRPLTGSQALSAAVIGGLGGLGVVYGVRGVRLSRDLGHPVPLARLDGDGVHLHEGLGVPDLPEHLAWTTIPWAWVSSVTHTTFDLRAMKAMGGADVPLEVLRFVLHDDTLLDARVERADLLTVAEMLGLTPAQTRPLLLGEAGSGWFDDAVAWIGTHRPDLPVVHGRTAPWTTRASPDRWAGRPRVAVVGAHGRLGRQVVDALWRRDDVPPVAVVRNEAHRALLERAGAEVRMVDVAAQGPTALAAALRGCAAVVHVAPVPVAVTTEAARRAHVGRVVVVAGADDATVLSVLPGSGLSWTAFRPAWLTDAAPTGEVVLGLEVKPGPVPRADLAEVVVACLRDEDAVGEAWPIAGAPPPAS